MSSIFILMVGMVFPFTLMKEKPDYWIAFICYPLCLFIMASQGQTISWFRSKGIL